MPYMQHSHFGLSGKTLRNETEKNLLKVERQENVLRQGN